MKNQGKKLEGKPIEEEDYVDFIYKEVEEISTQLKIKYKLNDTDVAEIIQDSASDLSLIRSQFVGMDPSNVTSKIFSSVWNKTNDLVRSKNKNTLVSNLNIGLTYDINHHSDPIVRHSRSDDIEFALSKLEESFPEGALVIRCHYFYGFSINEISERFEISAHSVRMRVNRSLSLLKEIFHKIIDNTHEHVNSVLLEQGREENLNPKESTPPPSNPELLAAEEKQTPASILKLLAAALPSEYEPRVATLARESHAFRQELAAQLAPALNAKLQGMPHGTLDEKKAICDFVANELEPLGLAVKDPKTGLPAKLKATTGNYEGIGTFYFDIYTNGKRKHSTHSDTLPDIDLIDSVPPKALDKEPRQSEGAKNWQESVGPKVNRPGRKRD